MINFYPCFIFYIEENPNFNKPFTVDKPTEVEYTYQLCDWMTLGRPILSYEDWAEKRMQYQNAVCQRTSECELRINKIAVSSFDDIVEFKTKNPTIRFVDNQLNDYFRDEQ